LNKALQRIYLAIKTTEGVVAFLIPIVSSTLFIIFFNVKVSPFNIYEQFWIYFCGIFILPTVIFTALPEVIGKLLMVTISLALRIYTIHLHTVISFKNQKSFFWNIVINLVVSLFFCTFGLFFMIVSAQ